MNKFDLEDRLIDFVVAIINIGADLESSKAGAVISSQLLRSGTSPALNYGEAQSGESRKDFIHKMTLVLKELRESRVSLKIIQKASLCKTTSNCPKAEKESNELISIFVKIIETAKKNLHASRQS